MNELTDGQIENIYLDHRDQLPNIPLIRAIITADRALQASRVAELEAQLESVGAGGVGAMIPKTIPDRTALIDLIAEHLSGTYHCTRVWSAWRVGTMSQDDFADVGESDTPSEITEAIIATLISQQIAEPAAATGWKWVPLEPTAEMLQAGQDTPVSESDEDAPEDYKAVYRAMLAAAPHPQQIAGLDKDAEIAALKAERDALRKDAELLDWLDQNIFSRENINFMGQLDPTMNMWVTFSPKGHQGSARNILDAAMQAQGVKSS